MIEHFRVDRQAISLAVSLYLPDGAGPHPVLLVLHYASGGTRQDPFYQHLVDNLPARGIGVCLYDRRGSGDSGGDFATTTFADQAADAAAVLDGLAARPDIDPDRAAFYGVSQGAWVAPLTAVLQPQVRCLVIVSGSGIPPAEQMIYAARTILAEAGYPREVIAQAVALRQQVDDYYRGKQALSVVQTALAAVQNEPWFSLVYLDRSEDLLADISQDKWHYELDYDPLAVWQQIHQPTIFFYADQDRWVPVEESIQRFKRVTTHLPQASYVLVPDADHLMGAEDGPAPNVVAEEYLQQLFAWLDTHLLT